ncbi:interferon-induced protein with tetratricopeptide repeats 5-like isoform X2 [Ambystoma mexicanum]|uniref:interferon-induced protein with tetratricopeptide repeats 5-like isoform X2 n=1 Tax=Ambystoma mexicanum TaxID=8296 RepID=UPI0037E8B102
MFAGEPQCQEEEFSEVTKNNLNQSLLQMECHFTWGLLRDDTNLDDLEDRMYEQIEFGITENKSMVYNLLAYAKHLKGNNAEAIESLQKAAHFIQKNHTDDQDRKSIVTYGNFSWVYYHLNQLDDAHTYITKVEDACKALSSPFRYKVQLSEIYGEQGWSCLKFAGRYYEKAKDCFQKALELEPDEPEWNYGYAIAEYRLYGFFKQKTTESDGEILELLRRAVKLNPRETVVMSLLSLKLQEMKQYEEAEQYMNEALEKTPDLPYLLRYAAKFYRKKGSPDESLKLLKRAINLTPTSGILHHQIGLCYREKLNQMKKNEKYSKLSYPPRSSNVEKEELIRNAIYHFELVVEKKPMFIYAYTDLANMYVEANQYEKAEETFTKVLAMANLTPQESQQVNLNYGRYLEYHKKSETEAIRHYKRGLMIKDANYERHMCKVCLKRLAEKMLQRNARNATAFGALGYMHQLDGEKMEAIECYEKALQLEPDNEEYLSGLCDMRLSI